MNRTSGIASLIHSVVMLLTITALCGATTARAATAYIVSGMVTAPGGVIASSDQTKGVSLARVLDFFIAPAEAKLSGLLPVPNGTPVDLVRVTDTGRVSAPIATARVQYGRYQFNLSALRRTVSSRLLVRVDNVATGAQMRAFVTDKVVNINPVSETAVRMALDSVASSQNGTLDNFTVTELADLTDSLDLLTSADHMRGADDIETSVSEIRNAVAGNRGIVSFLTASARPGQTNTGPGDIGNFFPFTDGATWTYRVRETEDGVASTPFTSSEKVVGTQLVNGVATMVIRNSNPDGDGKPDNDYYRKTSSGVFDWEPVKDGDRNSPVRTVRFPAAPGSSFKQSLGSMGLNRDIDRDGVLERFNFTSTTTVLGLETVRVPAGTLRNSLKIRTVITGATTVSSTRKRMTFTATGTEWYTKNLGYSRLVASYRLAYNGKVTTDTHVEELTKVGGFPLIGDFPFDRWKTLPIDSNDLVYDRVGGKFYASIPNDAARYANEVVVIDPYSASVEARIPVGGNPGALAVSEDGQFLYVGLSDPVGSIAQISIPTLTVEASWALSDIPGTSTARFPNDIAVQPGNPHVVAITTTRAPFDEQPVFAGAIVLDGGVERRDQIPHFASGPTTIRFTEDPSVAYGYNELRDTADVVKLSITSDGIAISRTLAMLYGTDALVVKYDNGWMYDNGGSTLREGNNYHGFYSTFGDGQNDYMVVEPASSLNRVTYVKYVYDNLYLQIFNMRTYSSVDDLHLVGTAREYPTHLEDFGSDGYAIRVLDRAPPYNTRSRLILARWARP